MQRLTRESYFVFRSSKGTDCSDEHEKIISFLVWAHKKGEKKKIKKEKKEEEKFKKIQKKIN